MPSSVTNIFDGRVATIATMHHKERVLAPLLTAHLGVTPLLPEGLDTNALGTFTREVRRPADQRSTARAKAEAALDLTGGDLAIASEGSFGPHPQMPFVACDREIVLLYDRKHNLEIVGEVVSTNTNFQSQQIHSVSDALTFAEAAGFPSHGLVVMAAENRDDKGLDQIVPTTKGITRESALRAAVTAALQQSPGQPIRIETDMRALYNPTRMAVIGEATQALIENLQRGCPQCHCPGFEQVQIFPGLPCSFCQTPTLLPLSALYRCQRCCFEQRRPYDEGVKNASPANCPYCNP